jgi:hypothetical protein
MITWYSVLVLVLCLKPTIKVLYLAWPQTSWIILDPILEPDIDTEKRVFYPECSSWKWKSDSNQERAILCGNSLFENIPQHPVPSRSNISTESIPSVSMCRGLHSDIRRTKGIWPRIMPSLCCTDGYDVLNCINCEDDENIQSNMIQLVQRGEFRLKSALGCSSSP